MDEYDDTITDINVTATEKKLVMKYTYRAEDLEMRYEVTYQTGYRSTTDPTRIILVDEAITHYIDGKPDGRDRERFTRPGLTEGETLVSRGASDAARDWCDLGKELVAAILAAA